MSRSEVSHPGVEPLSPATFRPGQERPSSPSTLPVPLTSLVGRDELAASLLDRLRDSEVRLVTLIGPGGVGKTRLALQVAAEAAPAFPDGAWLVPLAPLSDPALVASAIALAVGVRESGERTMKGALEAYFRDRRALLLLDSLEHLLEAAPLVTELLAACPHLTCLVTSRAVLRVSGEYDFPVPTLALPSREEPATVARIGDNPAVRLFVDRAQAARPSFALTDGNAADIAAICRELDGLPLAIELAAVRIRLFSPTALRARLTTAGDRSPLDLLVGGPHNAPARQRTLRDTIAWSYDLLAPEEQALFRRLAVFAGGFTLEAAEAVAQGPGGGGWGTGQDDLLTPYPPPPVPPSVLDGVAALIDHSLLRQAADTDGDTRYEMLETIREFGLEMLAASEEEAALRDRHAGSFLALAERTELAPFLPDGRRQLDLLLTERANLRTALAWFEQTGQSERQLRLAAALYFSWVLSGFLSELQERLERGLAGGESVSPLVQAHATWALGGVVRLRGDAERSEELLESALRRFRSLGDRRRTALALQGLGHVMLRRGDLDAARGMQEEALALLETLAREPWAARAASTGLTHLGNIALAEGDLDRAETRFDAALARQGALGHEPGTSHAYASHPLSGLGDVARGRRDPARALAFYQQALTHAWRFREVRAVAYALGGVAGTLAAAGEWEEAARLFGAAEALHDGAGLHFEVETMYRQRALGLPEPWGRGEEPVGSNEPLRRALGRYPIAPLPDPDPAARLWAAGRALPLPAAIDAALCATISDSKPVTIGRVQVALTEREREVLRLIVAGNSDREIGDALFISPRTASKHVANILAKLGAGSRAEAAAVAVRDGLD